MILSLQKNNNKHQVMCERQMLLLLLLLYVLPCSLKYKNYPHEESEIRRCKEHKE